RSSDISGWCRQGGASAWWPYVGCERRAVGAASGGTASERALMRILADNIHDPLGDDDHLADGLAVQGQFYRIERQNGSLDFRILGRCCNRDLTPLLAVDLDHQGHGVFNQQITFDLRPLRLGNQPLI